MTRKDYVKAAAIIRGTKAAYLHGATPTKVLDEIASRLADMFAADNPAFDRARFLTACGLEDK